MIVRPPIGLGIVLLLFQTLPIAVRRVAPLSAVAVSVAAVSLHIAIGYQGVEIMADVPHAWPATRATP